MSSYNFINYISVYIPTICQDVYAEIKNIPFYKTDGGYQYASYLLMDMETDTVLRTILNATNGISGITKNAVQKLQTGLQEYIHKLSEIVISDEDLTTWMTFQKELGGIREYHKCLEELSDTLLQICFEMAISDKNVLGVVAEEKEENSNKINTVISYEEDGKKSHLLCLDLKQQWVDNRQATQKTSNMQVLNHHNPFADISIEEQQFIYGSVLGQFETLGLTTSHTMTKIAKDTEKSYMALQPGFKIKKSRNLTKKEKQDVLFDDTLTTEIVQTDDDVYIYID